MDEVGLPMIMVSRFTRPSSSRLIFVRFSSKILMISYGVTKSSTLASFVLLVYDYALIIEEEVQYVWLSPISSGKIIYVATRHLGFATSIFNIIHLFCGTSMNVCHGFLQFRIWSRMLMFALIEILLIGRVYIVYNRCKKLLITLAVLFFGSPIVNLVLLYGRDHDTKIASSTTHTQETSLCSYDSTPGLTAAFLWLPLLSYIFILKILMLCRAWKVYKEGDKGLLRVIVMDSLYYYLSVFLVVLTNFILYLIPPTTRHPQWAIPWLSSIPVIAASRLFLNTRREFFRKQSMAGISLDVSAALNDAAETTV